MSNYIRACFCAPSAIPLSNLHNMLLALVARNCTYNTWIKGSIQGYQIKNAQEINIHESKDDLIPNTVRMLRIAELLSEPGYLTVKLGWKVNGIVYQTEIIQTWGNKSAGRSIRFCIEEQAFLPGASIEFMNYHNSVFKKYKMLISDFIKYISPAVGVIDYEADLLCEHPTSVSSIVSWGNFYSNEYLAQWSPDSINKVLQIVDESQLIEDIGLLTFIHPLQANQAWTPRHELVHNILQHH